MFFAALDPGHVALESKREQKEFFERLRKERIEGQDNKKEGKKKEGNHREGNEKEGNENENKLKEINNKIFVVRVCNSSATTHAASDAPCKQCPSLTHNFQVVWQFSLTRG
jgi:hypothetical protein